MNQIKPETKMLCMCISAVDECSTPNKISTGSTCRPYCNTKKCVERK